MFFIVLTGILSCGVLPFFALVGLGIYALFDIFMDVPDFGYWHFCGIGVLAYVAFSILCGLVEAKKACR